MIIDGGIMDILKVFHVALEVWGALFCLLAAIAIALSTSNYEKNKLVKLGMQVCCFILMTSDCLYLWFNGGAGTAAYYTARIAKCLVYISNYTYMNFIVIFLWQTLSGKEGRLPNVIRCVLGMGALGIALILITQFNGMVYYFDENNYYHRNYAYSFAQFLVIVSIVICFGLFIKYYKRLSRHMFLALLSYFILLTASTLLVFFNSPISLQNIAIALSTLIMFAVDYMDVSRRLEQSEEAYVKADYGAKHDSMTGVCNKEWGMVQIKSYIENMKDTDEASLCFIDIDDFKSINDTYGHASGDYWIKTVAKTLRNTCREDDVVCRYGGDEFVMLLKGALNTETLKLRIYQFDRHLKSKSSKRSQNVHCSIGVCRIKGSGNSCETAMQYADEALYDGKRGGKNSCVIYQLDKDNTYKKEKQQINLRKAD